MSQGPPPSGTPWQRNLYRLLAVCSALSFAWLFLCILGTPIVASAASGLTGSSEVLPKSILFFVFAATTCWARAKIRQPVGAEPGSSGRRGVWEGPVPRIVFLALFVLTVNLFVDSLLHVNRGWGLVFGHDQPQYFAHLHSWVFDRDLDFANEYAGMLGMTETMQEAHGDPGYNVAPIGTPLLWLPFYLAAHPGVLLLRAAGLQVHPNGLSAPYAVAAGFGTICLGWLGVGLVYEALRRYYSSRTAFFAALLIVLATPLLWYLYVQVWMSHACSFFAAALVLYLWARNRKERTRRQWAALGAAIGLAMLVRPNHAILIVLPVADSLRLMSSAHHGSSEKGTRPTMVGAALALACAGVVFSLQLTTWWMRQGFGWPPGNPMRWGEPALVSILFSSRKGLIAWHPVTAFGFIGLPFLWRRSRYLAACAGIVILANWYANASIDDWSGAGSFGMRRFVGVLPFFALGIAAFGSWAARLCIKRPAIPAAAIVALFAVYNALLVVQSRDLWHYFAGEVSFGQVWSNSAWLLHQRIGHVFSYPANLGFAWQHDVSPGQYDVAGCSEPITEAATLEGSSLRPYLGKGWNMISRESFAADAAFVTESRYCELLLPLAAGWSYEIEVVLRPPDGLVERQSVVMRVDGHMLAQAPLPPQQDTAVRATIPATAAHGGIRAVQLEFAEWHVQRIFTAPGSRFIMRTTRPVTSAAILSSCRVTPHEAPG